MAEKVVVPLKLPVTLATLKLLSPGFAKAVDYEIMEAFRDCNNRPKLKKARTLTLKVSFTPVINTDDDDPDLQQVNVAFAVSPIGRPQKVPNDSKVNINKNNQGFFAPDFPDDPRARHLFEKEIEEELNRAK